MKISGNLNINSEVLSQHKTHVYDIIGCCQEVHRELGPWLNEYVYQEALKVSFEEKHVPFEKEYYFQVFFMDAHCRINIIWIFCVKVM